MARDLIHPIESLRTSMNLVSPFPRGVVPIPQPVSGTSFFPGGTGIWNTTPGKPTPPMPIGGVMILGHDYHSEAGFQKTLARGIENLKGPTWGNLLKLLDRANIRREDCFFTNFFVGLRAGTRSTGKFPGLHDAAFVERCRSFLIQQISVQRPKLVITLGSYVPFLIAPLNPSLTPWLFAKTFIKIDHNDHSVLNEVTFPQIGIPLIVTFVALIHPCYRLRNVYIRRYKNAQGEAAESLMLADAMATSGIKHICVDRTSLQ